MPVYKSNVFFQVCLNAKGGGGALLQSLYDWGSYDGDDDDGVCGGDVGSCFVGTDLIPACLIPAASKIDHRT